MLFNIFIRSESCFYLVFILSDRALVALQNQHLIFNISFHKQNINDLIKSEDQAPVLTPH